MMAGLKTNNHIRAQRHPGSLLRRAPQTFDAGFSAVLRREVTNRFLTHFGHPTTKKRPREIVAVVGVRGFEPPASWSQTRHSNQAELHPAAGRNPVGFARTVTSPAIRFMQLKSQGDLKGQNGAKFPYGSRFRRPCSRPASIPGASVEISHSMSFFPRSVSPERINSNPRFSRPEWSSGAATRSNSI